MLRPSRPMMRPFMSSAESWTTRDGRLGGVAGGEPLHHDGEDVADAPVGVALGLLLDLARTTFARSWRVWSSSSLSSCWRACEADMPATRSSSRTAARAPPRARRSSRPAGARGRRAARAGSRPPPRARARAPPGAAGPHAARRSCRRRSWWRRPASPVAAARRRLAAGGAATARRRRSPARGACSSAAAATRPTASTTAPIRISMTSSPRRAGRSCPGPALVYLGFVSGRPDRARGTTRQASMKATLAGRRVRGRLVCVRGASDRAAAPGVGGWVRRHG